MYLVIMKKELKHFFCNLGNFLFVFVLPVLFVFLMTTALKDYVAKKFNTFGGGKVLVFNGGGTDKAIASVVNFREVLKESTGVIVEGVDCVWAARDRVNNGAALGLITIERNKISYYRSPYNESVGGKIARGVFLLAMGRKIDNKGKVKVTVLDKPRVDANAYFTFTELSFIMMFIALVIGHSVINERRLGTIMRIKIARNGINIMLVSKLFMGVIIGLLQVGTVYFFSSYCLKVKWLEVGYVFFVLLSVALLSSTFGVVVGMIVKTKTVLDSIVLMSVMLSSYAGGVLAPVYLMEDMRFVKAIIKISPLYWISKSLNSLNSGVVDVNTWLCLFFCFLLTFVLLCLYKVLCKRTSLVVEGS